MTENGLPKSAHRPDPPSAEEDVAKLRLELRDSSLEQLEDIGLVKWDRESNVVRKGPYLGNRKPQV